MSWDLANKKQSKIPPTIEYTKLFKVEPFGVTHHIVLVTLLR